MDLANNFGGKVNSSLVIKSLAWKTVIDILKEKKGIDITKDLKSISLKGETLFISSQSPHINFEIGIFESDIKETLKKKLKQV